MRVLPCGPSAILLEFADGAEAAAYRQGLDDAAVPDLVEVVPGARTLLLRGARAAAMPTLAAAARDVVPAPPRGAATGEVCLPVTYGGEDLAAVADLLGLSPEGVVAAHTGHVWTVAFCGFSPGFAYLTCAELGWHVPRRDTPRTRVPAGSVGFAGEYCGCYPTPSPGGWQLIGRTETRLFDPAADPPALLTPGTRVRFEATR